MYVKKMIFVILLHVIVKRQSIVDDSMIICDEVIKAYNEEIKTIPTNFNEKKVICNTQRFYILLEFY